MIIIYWGICGAMAGNPRPCYGFFSLRRTVNSNQITAQSIDRRNSIINSRRQPFKIGVFRANYNTSMVIVLKMQAHEMTAIACQNCSVIASSKS